MLIGTKADIECITEMMQDDFGEPVPGMEAVIKKDA